MKIIICLLVCVFNYSYSQHSKDSIAINNTINIWHRAAATADEKTYFSIIKNNGIFIGTDATELWTKSVMQEKVKKAFEKKPAWDFKIISRNIYFTRQTPNIAWFNELLDTWMGTCQSSGIVEKENDQWKIIHYQLSIAVPNDLVKSYLELLKNNKK